MLVYLKGPHSQHGRGRGEPAWTEGRQSGCWSCSLRLLFPLLQLAQVAVLLFYWKLEPFSWKKLHNVLYQPPMHLIIIYYILHGGTGAEKVPPISSLNDHWHINSFPSVMSSPFLLTLRNSNKTNSILGHYLNIRPVNGTKTKVLFKLINTYSLVHTTWF